MPEIRDSGGKGTVISPKASSVLFLSTESDHFQQRDIYEALLSCGRGYSAQELSPLFSKGVLSLQVRIFFLDIITPRFFFIIIPQKNAVVHNLTF